MNVMIPGSGDLGPLPIKPFDTTWRSWDGVHGGYLLAHATEAILPPQMDPRVIQANFLAAAPDGRALSVLASTLRSGVGGATTAGVVVDQMGTYLDVRLTAGPSREGPGYAGPGPPEAPPVHACEPFAFPVDLVPFAQHLEVRPANEARPLAGGDEAELVAWVSLRDVVLRPWQRVTVLLDALPPALYAVATLPAPIPTATMSVFLTEDAVTGGEDDESWALVRIRTDSAAAGWAMETSAVWAPSGRLLGVASQTRRVMSSIS